MYDRVYVPTLALHGKPICPHPQKLLQRFLASRGGDSRYRSGVLRARVLVLFFGGVGIVFPAYQQKQYNSRKHASKK